LKQFQKAKNQTPKHPTRGGVTICHSFVASRDFIKDHQSFFFVFFLTHQDKG
jgi:hypothetical protein